MAGREKTDDECSKVVLDWVESQMQWWLIFDVGQRISENHLSHLTTAFNRVVSTSKPNFGGCHYSVFPRWEQDEGWLHHTKLWKLTQEQPLIGLLIIALFRQGLKFDREQFCLKKEREGNLTFFLCGVWILHIKLGFCFPDAQNSWANSPTVSFPYPRCKQCSSLV